MLKFDFTLLVQIVEILILAVILNVLLIKPVMSVIQERKRYSEGIEKEIQNLLNQVEEGIKNYYATLNSVREEGVKKRESLKEEARRIEREELTKIAKELEKQKKEWENQFKTEFSKIRETVLTQREYFAGLIVEKLLGRKV